MVLFGVVEMKVRVVVVVVKGIYCNKLHYATEYLVCGYMGL